MARKGRPSIEPSKRKVSIYSEAIHLTLTPKQKEGVAKIAKAQEQSVVGYLRALINRSMIESEVSHGDQT